MIPGSAVACRAHESLHILHRGIRGDLATGSDHETWVTLERAVAFIERQGPVAPVADYAIQFH